MPKIPTKILNSVSAMGRMEQSDRDALLDWMRRQNGTKQFLFSAQRQVLDHFQQKFQDPKATVSAGDLLWLREVLLFLSKHKSHDDEQVYFSPGPDCLRAIIQNIMSARQSIDICVFTISDDRIARAIEHQYKQIKSVRIITDDLKILDRGSDISRLSGMGVPVKMDLGQGHMHHKFAVFDNARVLTGSYNWTRSAEAYNNENIIVSSNPEVVRVFSSEFDSLWGQLKMMR